MRWHYSKRMPSGKLVHVGVWESGKFIGVVIFGYGATPMIGRPYNLPQHHVCELVRIALTNHRTPVSRILAIAIRLLVQHSPGLRLLVSYADEGEGHHGGIYQAGNWTHVGGRATDVLIVNGKEHHPRALHHVYGIGGQSLQWLRNNVDPKAERQRAGVKHKYLYPLDDAMREQIAPLSRPYPKRVGSIDSDAPGYQPGEESAHLIPSLQTQDR